MAKSAPKHIAIVGGGFSGVMTAVNLARLSTRPLQSRGGQFGGWASRIDYKIARLALSVTQMHDKLAA